MSPERTTQDSCFGFHSYNEQSTGRIVFVLCRSLLPSRPWLMSSLSFLDRPRVLWRKQCYFFRTVPSPLQKLQGQEILPPVSVCIAVDADQNQYRVCTEYAVLTEITTIFDFSLVSNIAKTPRDWILHPFIDGDRKKKIKNSNAPVAVHNWCLKSDLWLTWETETTPGH